MNTENTNDAIKEELSYIIESILTHMNVLEIKTLKINFKKSVKKLSELTTNYENNDINNFIYFSKNLFVDSKNNFDYDVNKVYCYITKEDLKNIFSSLLKNIHEENFFTFLVQLGEIFEEIYSNYDDMLPITSRLCQKHMNNYECLLDILSCGKKEHSTKLIFANYDQFYSIKYIDYITTNIIFAININYKLSTSGKNYDNIINHFINELFFKKYSNEKEQLNEIENFLNKSINIYSCNCIFYMDDKFKDFFSILTDFITENNFKLFINEQNVDEKIKSFFLKYIKCFSLELMKLLEDFNENSLLVFEKSLYEFISNYIDVYGGNYYLNLMSNIQSHNKLTPEELGLISVVCFNRRFVKDIEAKINNNEDLKEMIEECGFNFYENLVVVNLVDIHKKKGLEKKEFPDMKIKNNNVIINNNITEKNDVLQNVNIKENNQIQTDKEKTSKPVLEQNIKEKIKAKDNISKDSKENGEIKEENKSNLININDDIKDNEKKELSENNQTSNNYKNLKDKKIEYLGEQIQKFNSELSAFKRQYEEDKIKNQKFYSEIEEYKRKNDQYKKENDEYKRKNDQYKKENDQYKKENDEYKRKNDEYKRKNDEYKKENEKYKIKINNLNEELKEIKEEVKELKIIHKSIYFRDISKLYIKQFINEHKNLQGINLYQTCQNILKYDFKNNNLKYLGPIMIKIVTHYLTGNDRAHIKYFIREIDEHFKNKIEIINANYNSFMKFSDKEQRKISQFFNINEASIFFK